MLASIDYKLGKNVENLILTGSDKLNATGNELANLLAGNIDTIPDFQTGEDKLALDDKLFKKLLGDSDLSDNFETIATGGTASNNNHYLLYETDSGKLYYDADGAGKKSMLLVGVFVDGESNHPLVAASDFVVV